MLPDLMRRLFLTVVVGLLLATSVSAQIIQPGQQASLGAANAVAIVSVAGETTLTVQVQGTWTGTLAFESSLNGSAFTATNCTAINGTSAVTTTTTTGVWSCGVIGLNFIQVRFSSFGSGTASVLYNTAYVAGGASGGSSGAVSITQGGNTAAVNGSSQLSVNCANCSGSGVSQQDNTGFTPGTTNFVPVGGEVDDVATTAVAENSAGAARLTVQRGLHVNLRTVAGTETGVAAVPLQVSLANTAANATAVKVDGSAATQPVSGTVTTTPPANASTNVAQVAGTTTDTNSGTKSAGTLRVVLATDQPALTNKLLVTPDSVALPANQSVNVSQINAVTPLMGNGVTGTGSQRVTIASDNTAFSVNANAGTNLNTSALALETGGNLATVKTNTDTPTTIFNGKTSVTTAGTRVTLAASQAVKAVTIKALSTNTGFIYVGNASVASTTGLQLRAGESVSLNLTNLNTVNLDSSVNGEGVTYLGVQ